jgi:diguanylate cyclase (GGDEF)-like protein
VLVRPWATVQRGPSAYAADVFTLSGYALLITGLALMLRSGGSLQRHAVTDGIIICLGTGLVSTVLFALPAAEIHTRPSPISIMAGLYPLLDVVLLLLLLNLGFSSAVRLASFRLIAFGMVCMFIGDTGYAWIGARGQLTGSPLLDLPFLLTFTSFGVAALHPSMTGLSAVVARGVQAWSWLRLLLIVPALLSPTVLALLPSPSVTDRVVVVVTSVALTIAVLTRAISAVRGHSRAQEVLRNRATHDAFTGLPNRVALREHLQTLLKHQQNDVSTWLLYLDLDEFRLINDHWGHETGDEVLREVARRLELLAGERSFVARTGGDEFAVTGQSPQDPCRLAEAIQRELSEPVRIPGLDLVVTSSIGIARVTDQETADAVLRDADTALFRAKADGRNRCTTFHPGMRQSVRTRVETELALRQAIGQAQLWVAYQPMVDPRTEQTIGAEALVRWTHPERGPISPAEFIPVAEETGLITQIGSLVLEESLQQLARWREAGVLPDGFTMSVNVSARQLRDTELLPRIFETMARHRISADRLVVELTESVIMADTEAASEVLAGLRAAGLGLSVDDFGTGYSSLSYLSRFPVTEVKIDRSFVAALGDDRGAEAIVRAVVAMASALGLDVVAEGVETLEQRAVLRQLQIPRAQGWLWGAAESADRFAARHLPHATAVAAAP